MWFDGLKASVSLANALLNGNETKKDENFTVSGTINNLPVNLAINKGASASSSFGTIQRQNSAPVQHSPGSVRLNSATGPQNRQRNTKSGPSQPSKLKDDKNDYHFLKIPNKGNVEITIKSTEKKFSKMNVQDNNSKQVKANQVQHKTNKNKVVEQHCGNCKTVIQKGQERKNDNSMAQRRNQCKAKSGHINSNQLESNTKQGYNKGKTWMYLGRIKPGTSQSDMLSYLSHKFPGHRFEVEKLPKWKDAITESFKVNVDNDILNDFKNPNNWPNDTKITKYIFFKD